MICSLPIRHNIRQYQKDSLLKFIKEKHINANSKYKNPKTITPAFKGREEKVYN
jgi:hypothetical protein